MKKSKINFAERAKEVLDIEIEGLREVRDHLGAEFQRAIEVILERLNHGGKIVVTGLGKNLHIGRKIAATLTSTGSTAVVLHPAEAMHGDMGLLDAKDVVLALSYSGSSEELVTLLPFIKRLNVPIVALTGDTTSSLAQHCDVIIPVTIQREACPFNLAPTTSTTATLAVGDALAMVLIEARGFQKDDYARLHPGGAIGRSLLMTIADIMRGADRLAKVQCGTPIRDAVLAMTSARTGAVVVVNDKEQVKGILTDGDLRRHLFNGTDITTETVERIMSAKPITLNADALAVEALAIFEKHNIDDLIIVNDDGKLVGMVDIQDLPKFKIL